MVRSSLMCGSPRVLFDTRIQMRDGVELSADLYGLEPEKKKPAVLVRTPYGKQGEKYVEAAKYFSSNGYAFVSSDVRGRGDSDGKFSPYENEGPDGYDTIEWICKQPWSNGKVATWGASYCGRIQWYTALLQPAGLKAMIPIVSPSDPFVEDPTGLPSPLSVSWDFLTAGKSMQDLNLVDWDPVYNHLPLTELDTVSGRNMAHWQTRLEHQFMDEFVQGLCYQNAYEKITVPALHISGWYDDEQIGTPLNYWKMTEVTNKEVSENQSLLMGGWGHRINTFRKLGEFDFGPDAVIDILSYQKEWLDRYMKDIPTDRFKKPVRLFIMGENRWKNYAKWPPENSEKIKMHLVSNGSANSKFGDGKLQFTEPDYDSKVDSYSYDPEDPVPYISDQNYAQIGGPDDYSAIERRDDVLVYTSEPFEHDYQLTGPVTLTLDVSTSCEDTDFTGKLLVVSRTGKAIRLCDGVTRMSRREGHRSAKPAEPGKAYTIEIVLWNTAYRWKPGERMRLEISSSAFPKYAKNLNVFGDQAKMTGSRIAQQKVFHGKKHNSALYVYSVRD